MQIRQIDHLQAACALAGKSLDVGSARMAGPAGSRGGISITFWFVYDNPAKPGVSVQLSHLVVGHKNRIPLGGKLKSP